MTTAKRWSYSTGERGRNRVRVYEDRTGILLVEYYERAPDRQLPVRKRVSLGHRERERAKQQADELAVAFGRGQAPADGNVTLETLFDIYEREVTPTKSAGKQKHDAACAEMLLRLFGARRKAKSLNRRDWDRFIQLRRSGGVAPSGARHPKPVGDRQIEYDLRWLLAVLNWAATARDDADRPLLERNPLKGLVVPTEENPSQPVFAPQQYEALRKVAAQMDWRFELAVILAHETGHRIGSIRRLRWSDLQLKRKWVHWAARTDKSGHEHETPFSRAVANALGRAQRAGLAIGEAWVFPSPNDPSLPCSRHIMRDWMEQALKQLKFDGHRLGWHAFRRKFATELKHVPLKDLCELGGWKDPRTILLCYQKPDEGTMRAALAKRRPVAALGAAAKRQSNRQ